MMEEMTTFLASGDKLIKNENGFFVHYIGREEPTEVTEERGTELLFATCESLRMALMSLTEGND
jgi:hypothetical protein